LEPLQLGLILLDLPLLFFAGLVLFLELIPNYRSTHSTQASADPGAESWPACYGADDSSDCGASQRSNSYARFSLAQLASGAPGQN